MIPIVSFSTPLNFVRNLRSVSGIYDDSIFLFLFDLYTAHIAISCIFWQMLQLRRYIGALETKSGDTVLIYALTSMFVP